MAKKSLKSAKRHPSEQDIKVAVDNCVFTVRDGKLHILLIQMKKKPFSGKWALPGGLIDQNETLDEAAARILFEETGVRKVYLEQLYTFSAAGRDPFGRVISTAYFALIPSWSIKLRASPKYAGVKWQEFEKLPELAYDHNQIARYGKQRLVWKLGYTNVAWSLLSQKFTFSELQKVYEAVLGRKIDKRNFRRRMLALKIIEPTGERTARGAHRPAMLYRFKSRKTMFL